MVERPLLVLQGGTFDPVHLGHLAIAEAARDRLQVPVHLMPAADPPHRPPTGADSHQRAAMLAMAVAGRPGLTVDLREVARGVPSRTIDTLAGLRETLGDAQPVVCVLGADAFAGLPGWKGWPTLLDEAHWVVAARGDAPLQAGLPGALATAVADRWTDDPDVLRQTRGGRVLRLDQPLHPASASLIRARIADGGDWRSLVPDPVAAYIDHHRLYIDGGAGSGARDPLL